MEMQAAAANRRADRTPVPGVATNAYYLGDSESLSAPGVLTEGLHYSLIHSPSFAWQLLSAEVSGILPQGAVSGAPSHSVAAAPTGAWSSVVPRPVAPSSATPSVSAGRPTPTPTGGSVIECRLGQPLHASAKALVGTRAHPMEAVLANPSFGYLRTAGLAWCPFAFCSSGCRGATTGHCIKFHQDATATVVKEAPSS